MSLTGYSSSNGALLLFFPLVFLSLSQLIENVTGIEQPEQEKFSTTTTTNFCTSSNNVFTVRVDLYASETGYFTFEECGHIINPTLGMEVGQRYTFIQSHRTNYHHPLGFAYAPDGGASLNDNYIHDDWLLDPAISKSSYNSSCAETKTCPAPMYIIQGGQYYGTYSNIPEIMPATTHQDDTARGVYESLFAHPLPDWAANGDYYVDLLFDDIHYDQDIFYFDLIHQSMTGRIKLLRNGIPINIYDYPPIEPFYYEDEMSQRGRFDQICGTVGLDNFQVPHPECPNTFVCHDNHDDASSIDMRRFTDCVNAMNCHMFSSLTSYAENDKRLLYIHQAIPLQKNAVNMAKALLNTGKVYCPNILEQSNPDCMLERILLETINQQNYELQQMRHILYDMDWPDTPEDCIVPFKNHYDHYQSDYYHTATSNHASTSTNTHNFLV